MSIQVNSDYGYIPYTYSKQTKDAGKSFADSLKTAAEDKAEFGATGNTPCRQTPATTHINSRMIHFPLLRENSLTSGSLTVGSYHVPFIADWADDSTEDRPKVVVTIYDKNGNASEKTVYINDINPHNATLLEMKILSAYLGMGTLNPALIGARIHLGEESMRLDDRHNFFAAFDSEIHRYHGYGSLLGRELATRLESVRQMFYDFFLRNNKAM
jgi:hypothetical protein